MGSWEETQPRWVTPPDQRGMTPDHIAACSGYKVGRRKKEVGCLEEWPLSSQVTITCDGALLSWIQLNTCLPMEKNELIPCVAWLVCAAFALPLNCLYINPQIIYLLPFSFSHGYCWWRSEQMTAWDLAVSWDETMMPCRSTHPHNTK